MIPITAGEHPSGTKLSASTVEGSTDPTQETLRCNVCGRYRTNEEFLLEVDAEFGHDDD